MSNLIKSTYYISSDDIKLIEVADNTIFAPAKDFADIIGDDQITELSEEEQSLLAMKDEIIRDAEMIADNQIKQAMEDIELLKQQTNDQIDQWWNERRLQDDEIVADSQKNGFNKGYEDGLVSAESIVREEHSKMLEEIQSILEQAHIKKELIIQESEPFLIELSCSIAEKIIGKQLELSPEWILQIIKKILSRRREQGIITLCVSLSQFTYIQDARDELSLSIDSQAELAIIPDTTVDDFGCVIRSAFGSIDARIDTQLTEIKSALHQMAMRSEEAQEHG